MEAKKFVCFQCSSLPSHICSYCTFLLSFFHYVIIDDRSFGSAIGFLLNTLPLARHTSIIHFWTVDAVVKRCTLKWTHPHTQPWGEPVPYQCDSCRCIQAWDQKGQGASSEIGRDVIMRCSFNGEKEQCNKYLKFHKPTKPCKTLKLLEGVWVALDIPKSDHW